MKNKIEEDAINMADNVLFAAMETAREELTELVGRKIESRWEKTGLLEGLSEEEKRNCSRYLQDGAEYILELNETEKVDETITTLFIPGIRRIYDQLKEPIDARKWFIKLSDFYDKNAKIMKQNLLEMDPNFDWEAELLAMAVDSYIAQKSNYKKIKDHLQKWGGLVITDRQVGKTTALIHILHEDPNAVVLTVNWKNAKYLIDKYCVMFNEGRLDTNIRENVKSRVFSSDSDYHEKLKPDSKIYIDEFYFHRKPIENWYGAVSTMAFPIKIMKLGDHDEKFKEILDEKQYQLEIGLFMEE